MPTPEPAQQPKRALDPEEYKRLEINHSNKSASGSLEWYRTMFGVRSDIEIHTVLRHLRLRPESRVLDVGCGAGRITLAIAPYVRSITAVDIAPANIEALRQHARDRGFANVTGRTSDMNELRIDGERFDRAVAVQAIQHIPGASLRLDAVRRIREALDPGGLFVTVNYRWGGIISDEKEGTHEDGRYRFSFTTEETRQLLNDAGFTQISVGGCVNTPFRAERLAALAPWAFVRLDAALSRLPVSRHTGKYLIATGRA